jgi:SUMO ligase MMS21 Smc5/6 complex component
MPVSVYLISNSGLNLYTYKFEEHTDEAAPEDYLISCTISGINKALKCMVKSDDNVERIEIGDYKLLFDSGTQVMALLLLKSNEKEIKDKLKTLTTQFEKRCAETLQNWTGNRTIFKDTKNLIENLF